jgi:hypothetical protein
MNFDSSSFIPFDMFDMLQTQFWAGALILGGMAISMASKKAKGGPLLIAIGALAAAEHFYQVSEYIL